MPRDNGGNFVVNDANSYHVHYDVGSTLADDRVRDLEQRVEDLEKALRQIIDIAERFFNAAWENNRSTRFIVDGRDLFSTIKFVEEQLARHIDCKAKPEPKKRRGRVLR